MDRELKFRAWDEPTDVNGPTGMSYNARPDCDATAIMQYTGLKDCNGVDVYEGDVVTDAVGRSWVIGYKESAATFVFKWVKDQTQQQTFARFLSVQRPLKVIGNVYEHSHLLEPQ